MITFQRHFAAFFGGQSKGFRSDRFSIAGRGLFFLQPWQNFALPFHGLLEFPCFRVRAASVRGIWAEFSQSQFFEFVDEFLCSLPVAYARIGAGCGWADHIARRRTGMNDELLVVSRRAKAPSSIHIAALESRFHSSDHAGSAR